MSSLKSSGDGLPAFENDFSADSNPYAYPYFHCNGSSPLIYELVVQFARHWNELSETTDSEHVDIDTEARAQLEALVRQIHQCCKEQPTKASWRDSCGDTALHRLCQVARFPSLDDTGTAISFAQMLVSVAEALVDAHPYPGSATRACNNWKETPLHQFCSHCAFPNNILVGDGGDESLLKHVEKNPMFKLLKLLSRDGACSLRNCWGSYPLHDACGLPGWELPLTDNDKGWKRPHDTSLFLKWMKQQHGCMIHFLISQNVKAVGLLRVEDGQTPLYRAFQSLKCSADVIQTLLSHMDDTSTAPSSSSTSCLSILWKHYEQVPPLMMDFNPQEQAENLGILWQTTVLALQKVSCHGLLVHSTVTKTNDTYCPLHVVQLAARLYRQQLLQKDKDGNTPLSLAIQNSCSADIVNALLWENPRAASVRDGNGRVPLVLAIDKGVYSYHDVLAHVFAAEPAAVTARDPITALFPFCIAALNMKPTQSDCCDDKEQVSTIYQLLRIDPSVLLQP